MLVILELVETGTSGSEKDNVSGHGGCRGMLDGVFESLGMVDFGSGLYVGFDFGGGSTDGIHAFDAGAEQVVENSVIAALVFATQDEMNVGGEGCEGFDGGVDVGGLGVIVVIDAGDFGYEFEAVLDGFEVLD